MRKTKITQKGFERVFWLNKKTHEHRPLCHVFSRLKCGQDFQIFWDEINYKKYHVASWYLSDYLLRYEIRATWRLMIAQEFIEQFNKGIDDEKNN